MISSPLLSSLLSHLHILHPHACVSSRSRVFSDPPFPSVASEAHLAEQLQKLITSLSSSHGNGSSLPLLSLDWMCKALEVVISSHESVRQAIMPTHSLPPMAPLSRPHYTEKATQQHTEDIVKMLDACCLIEEALSETNAYVKASRLAVKRIQNLKLERQGDIQRAMQTLLFTTHSAPQGLGHPLAEKTLNLKSKQSTKGLQACSSMLRRMGDKLPAPSICEPLQHKLESAAALMGSLPFSDALPAALYGGKVTTLFFLRLLSTALCFPGSYCRKSSIQLSGQPIWGPSLLALQAQVNTEFLSMARRKRKQGCEITYLPELHALDAALTETYETLLKCKKASVPADRVEHLVASTSTLIEQVERSLSTLRRHIQHIFSSLIYIRIALLNCT